MIRLASMSIAFALSLTGGTALAAPKGDPLKPCAACHSLEPGDNRLGPSLAGVFGRPAGSMAGYRFSNALRRSGIQWDAKTLDDFLASPQGVVPGNRMPYSGLADPLQRKAIIQALEGARGE